MQRSTDRPKAMGDRDDLAELAGSYKTTPGDRARAVNNVLKKGHSITLVDGMDGVGHRTVRRRIQRYERDGIGGPGDDPDRGAKPDVAHDMLEWIARDLHQKPMPVPRFMAEEVHRLTGRRYNVCHMRRFLHGIGMPAKGSVTVYRHATSQGTVREQREWARAEVRHAHRKGFKVVLQDEDIGRTGTDGRRQWSPEGEPATVTRYGGRENVAVFGVVAEDKSRLMRQHGWFDTGSFAGFLGRIRRRWGRVLLIVDNASQHKAGAVRRHLEGHPEIRIMCLPVATPRLNVVEEWRHRAKYEPLVSKYYHSIEDLMDAITRYFRTYRMSLNLYKHLWHTV